jgi:hypothetical protein
MAEEKPLTEQQVAAEEQVVAEEQSITAETTIATEPPITLSAETSAATEQPMAEESAQSAQENRASFFQLCSQLNAPWWSGIQKIAAWYITTNEQVIRKTLDLQEQATDWAKDTPWAPLFQSQHSLMSQWIDGSLVLARSLWQLAPTEKAQKKQSAPIGG